MFLKKNAPRARDHELDAWSSGEVLRSNQELGREGTILTVVQDGSREDVHCPNAGHPLGKSEELALD